MNHVIDKCAKNSSKEEANSKKGGNEEEMVVGAGYVVKDTV